MYGPSFLFPRLSWTMRTQTVWAGQPLGGTQHVYFVHKLHHVFAGHGLPGMMKGKRPRGEPADTAAMLLHNGRGGSVDFRL